MLCCIEHLSLGAWLVGGPQLAVNVKEAWRRPELRMPHRHGDGDTLSRGSVGGPWRRAQELKHPQQRA